MKPHDLQIEHLEAAGALVQGWGRLREKPFQFHANRGRWQFAVFDNPLLEPWDYDLPVEHHTGMYMNQRYESEELAYAEAERIILRCADAYLFMIGRRQSDLSLDA
jgi:hypothetical protein